MSFDEAFFLSLQLQSLHMLMPTLWVECHDLTHILPSRQVLDLVGFVIGTGRFIKNIVPQLLLIWSFTLKDNIKQH